MKALAHHPSHFLRSNAFCTVHSIPGLVVWLLWVLAPQVLGGGTGSGIIFLPLVAACCCLALMSTAAAMSLEVKPILKAVCAAINLSFPLYFALALAS